MKVKFPIYFLLSALATIFRENAIAQDQVSASTLTQTKVDTINTAFPYDTVQQLIHDHKNTKKLAQTATTKAEGGTPFKNVFRYDFYGTVTALLMSNNPEGSDRGHWQFYYNINISDRLTIKKFNYLFSFFNDYGYRQYFDSLGNKTDDNYNFRNNVQWDLWKNKLRVNIDVNVKSQFWRGYQYMEDDTGGIKKILYTSYFSPGYVLLSGGLMYNTKDDISIQLGLVGGKTTKIRNQDIYESRQSEVLYGVKKGERRKFDLGYNLNITAPITQLTRNLYWEVIAIAFVNNKNVGYIKEYTFDINNAFHFLFLKYLRLSLRTKAIYDKSIQDKIFTTHQLSVGFYLTNKVK